jgi:hypothetical protein
VTVVDVAAREGESDLAVPFVAGVRSGDCLENGATPFDVTLLEQEKSEHVVGARGIAAAERHALQERNGVDPMKLRPGMTLIIPALEGSAVAPNKTVADVAAGGPAKPGASVHNS